jgi:hypothetical protein
MAFESIKPPVPPVPPPIEQFRISKEKAVEDTSEARRKLFETEKGKTYYGISSAASNGNYHLNYKYPENCNYEDIISLKEELEKQGFAVEYHSGLYGDTLEIAWYLKE